MDKSFQKLIVLQVSALVSATADFIRQQDPDWPLMDIEAHVYEVLAVNCREKAELAKAFAAQKVG